MKAIENYTPLIGRLLISAIFLIAGVSKFTDYAKTQGYMESVGVPGLLLPLVIATEVFGGQWRRSGFI